MGGLIRPRFSDKRQLDRPNIMDNVQDMPMEVSVSLQTDSGCVRDSNEDAGCSIIPSDPLVLERKGRLTLVADGMGGHSGGEVASTWPLMLSTMCTTAVIRHQASR